MTTESIVHNPYQSNNLHLFYIDFDLDDDSGLTQRKHEFYNTLFNDIPRFAFGENQLLKRKNMDHMEIVREALQKIYNIPEIKEARKYYLEDNNVEDKYIKKGEFGELVLFHLLRKYFGADSLISKIYFKDSISMAPHGFDAVHVNSKTRTLWLGESKLYKDKNAAITELIKDLKEHFNTNFFASEFTIITNRVHDEEGNTDDFILELINPKTKILSKLANIKIALFAGYNSDSISERNNVEEEEFIEKLDIEAQTLLNKLQKGKDKHPWSNHLDIYLFLLPLNDKTEFVKDLHYKLKGGQLI